MNKKGMVSNLQAIAFGIIALVVLVGIGLVVLTQLQTSVATCATDYTYNATQAKCVNSTNGDPTNPLTASWVAMNYGATQLGSTGLLGWLPAVIALLIGVFFLAYFAGKKSGKSY